MRPAKAQSEQQNEQSPPVPAAFSGYRRRDRRLPRSVTLAAVAWALAVAACSAAILWSSRQPGAVGVPPARLPALQGFSHIAGSAVLIVAVHPHCPCTRATVANLERALQATKTPCATVALLYTPRGRSEAWSDTNLARQLSRLPSTRLVRDDDGRTAAQLGMYTSGQVLFYDEPGALRFAGGITPARGHEGECAPLDQLKALMAGRTPAHPAAAPALASVFGCPLCNEGAAVCSPKPSNEP